MTYLFRRAKLGALPLLAVSTLLVISTASFADESAQTNDRGLLLLAAKPAKSGRSTINSGPKAPRPPELQQDQPQEKAQVQPRPADKRFELRYKLERGDVLRYEVSHKASIRSTIDETTQSAPLQSPTSSRERCAGSRPRCRSRRARRRGLQFVAASR